MTPRLTIVSGGQTGPDRAALDLALNHGFPVGGWCPARRWAEDGPLPDHYPLTETPGDDPAERTWWNVRDSDATLILSPRPLMGGTALSHRAALRLGRPVFVADPRADAPDAAVAWIAAVLPQGGVLNVAGPRESEVPGVQAASTAWLGLLFDRLADTTRG